MAPGALQTEFIELSVAADLVHSAEKLGATAHLFGSQRLSFRNLCGRLHLCLPGVALVAACVALLLALLRLALLLLALLLLAPMLLLLLAQPPLQDCRGHGIRA